jgi:hypothetical protein
MAVIARLVFVLAAAAVLSGSAEGAAPKLHGNNFYVNCRFSHTANDDPIVLPGQPGASHPHTFFGNTSTDADSTPAGLLGAGTTCKPRADKAAYWVPTLFQSGREIRPRKVQLYYNLRGYDQMHPFPAGLRMVAGNAHAVRPQSPAVTYWTCGGRAGERSAPLASVPRDCADVPLEAKKGFFKACATCPTRPLPRPRRQTTYLELHVNFPDCWDGRHLDSPDHRSHMAYSRNYRCPTSHPVKVPLIRLTIRYPITDGRGVFLASGGQLSGHADFVNAWNERLLTRLVDECFHDRPCDPQAIAGS